MAGFQDRRRGIATRVAATTLLFCLNWAHANDSDGQLQEVVVTAQKRVENAKDVPASITLISGDDLVARRIINFDDLTGATPNFSFASGGTEGLSNLTMRGISSSSGAAVVGIYFDETPISMSPGGFIGQAEPMPFDLARVEVLRGPQGTLYGASSMAGAIRFIPNSARLNTHEFVVASGIGGTDYGGPNYDASVVANTPLSETLAARVGVYYAHNSGWINHFDFSTGLQTAAGINSVDHAVVKLGSLYQPFDELAIEPAVWMQQVKSSDSSVWYQNLGLYNTNKEVREPSKDRLFVPSLKITRRFSAAELVSVSSYFWRENARQLDGTYFNSGAFALFFLDPNPVFANHQPENDSIIAHIASPVEADTKITQFTQELRATSTIPGAHARRPIRWTAGLYYSHQKQYAGNTEFAPGLNTAFTSIYGYSLSSPIVQNALGSTATTFVNDQMFIAPITTTAEEYAAYGELTYDLLPRLHLSAGLRYGTARQTYEINESGFYSIGAPSPYSADSSASATTPRFSAVYDLTETSTVYGTVGKGYRVGGGTGPVPQTLCEADLARLGLTAAPTSYSPDSLWSYELGTKLLLADRSLSIELGAFLIEWSGIQQTIFLPSCGFAFTANFGDAQSYGGEVQVAYKPTFLRNLTLGLSAGSTHAEITHSTDPGVAAVGQSPLFVPKWTATATVDYVGNITSRTAGFAHVEYARTGMSYGSFQSTDPGYSNPAYGVVNGSLGFRIGSLEVSLWGKNLANSQTVIQRPNVAAVSEAYTVPPLTLGLAVIERFQ